MFTRARCVIWSPVAFGAVAGAWATRAYPQIAGDLEALGTQVQVLAQVADLGRRRSEAEALFGLMLVGAAALRARGARQGECGEHDDEAMTMLHGSVGS